jgi:lipopolysaccharide O-acetyltransferase
VTILDHDHGAYFNLKFSSSPDEVPIDRVIHSSPIRIGNRVWIGEGAVILKGVTIGEGSIVGAGAVVTKSIPRDSLAVGIPAKVISKYDRQSLRWSH